MTVTAGVVFMQNVVPEAIPVGIAGDIAHMFVRVKMNADTMKIKE